MIPVSANKLLRKREHVERSASGAANQGVESGGEQFLLLWCRAKVDVKGLVFPETPAFTKTVQLWDAE